MRFAQRVLRRMLRMWFAAVCSLMNSAAPISRLLRPRATSAQDLDLARRQPVGRRSVGARGAERPYATEQRRHADALGQRGRLAEQRADPIALAAGPRASSMRAYS